jgi:hypothetical protein
VPRDFGNRVRPEGTKNERHAVPCWRESGSYLALRWYASRKVRDEKASLVKDPPWINCTSRDWVAPASAVDSVGQKNLPSHDNDVCIKNEMAFD